MIKEKPIEMDRALKEYSRFSSLRNLRRYNNAIGSQTLENWYRIIGEWTRPRAHSFITNAMPDTNDANLENLNSLTKSIKKTAPSQKCKAMEHDMAK